jgi:DNA (cytosine-5)-methyltransferase 1
MTKPRLLDLCCCAGGAAVGYARSGFEVVGVDIVSQPDYPFTFIQADALTFPLDGFDAYHASPTCKGFSVAASFHHSGSRHPNLIPALRARLAATGKPYIIENVAGSPLIKCLMLCGEMFALNVLRHRYFESNVKLSQPFHPRHTKRAGKPGAIPAPGEYWCVGGHFGNKQEAASAMGIDWMTRRDDIAQAIPPPYTEFLGRQLLRCFVQPDLWSYESEVLS